MNQFKRNRYFYGKLLTVKDFEDEQCYFNGKRYLINRVLGGRGIVMGLNVNANLYKEKNICDFTVSKGIAIDGAGREIIVSGGKFTYNYTSDDINETRYLFLEYVDDKFSSQNINNTIGEVYGCDKSDCVCCDEFCEYNRKVESYKLSVGVGLDKTFSDLAKIENLEEAWIEEAINSFVVDGKEITVTKMIPKYVHPFEHFEIRVKISTKEASLDKYKSITLSESLTGVDFVDIADHKFMSCEYKKEVYVIEINLEKITTNYIETGYTLRSEDTKARIKTNEIIIKKKNNQTLNWTSSLESFNNEIHVVEDIFEKVLSNITLNENYVNIVGDIDETAQDKNKICLASFNINENDVQLVSYSSSTYKVYSNQLLFNLISLIGRRLGRRGLKGDKGVKEVQCTSIPIAPGEKPDASVVYNDHESKLDFVVKLPKFEGNVKADVTLIKPGEFPRAAAGIDPSDKKLKFDLSLPSLKGNVNATAQLQSVGTMPTVRTSFDKENNLLFTFGIPAFESSPAPTENNTASGYFTFKPEKFSVNDKGEKIICTLKQPISIGFGSGNHYVMLGMSEFYGENIQFSNFSIGYREEFTLKAKVDPLNGQMIIQAIFPKTYYIDNLDFIIWWWAIKGNIKRTLVELNLAEPVLIEKVPVNASLVLKGEGNSHEQAYWSLDIGGHKAKVGLGGDFMSSVPDLYSLKAEMGPDTYVMIPALVLEKAPVTIIDVNIPTFEKLGLGNIPTANDTLILKQFLQSVEGKLSGFIDTITMQHGERGGDMFPISEDEVQSYKKLLLGKKREIATILWPVLAASYKKLYG